MSDNESSRNKPSKTVSELIKSFRGNSISPNQSHSQNVRPVAEVPPTQRNVKPVPPKKPTILSDWIPNKPKLSLPSRAAVYTEKPTPSASFSKAVGKSVQILSIAGDTFKIHTDAFIEVLKKVPDLPIVIISINGCCREGKSYVMNYFIRYLKFQEDPDWFNKVLPNEDLFSWRSGRERETIGINLYSDPFIINQGHRRVAVLLLDCQGLFDQHTTFRQNAVIYALSNLLSSVMIYNVKCKIEENLLQNIQYFSSYTKAISTEEAIEDELPHFMFLLRDFQYFQDYQLGFHSRSTCPSSDASESGNYFEDTMLSNTDMPAENQSVRNEILGCYSDVGMYLMPFPGRNFILDSGVNDADEDFQELLKKFILLMTSSEHLVTKKIGGVEVTGRQLIDYVQIWGEECAASATMFPEARTIGDSTVLLQNEVAANNAFASYKQNFSKFLHSDESGVSDEEVQIYHSKLVAYALEWYKASRTLGGETIIRTYNEKIVSLCESIFGETYFPMNAEIRKRNKQAEEYSVRQAATEAYIRKMEYQIQRMQKDKEESARLEKVIASKQLENQKLLESRTEITSRLQNDIGNALPELRKQREFFAGVKDKNFSQKKVKVTKELYLHELDKAKKEHENLQLGRAETYDVECHQEDIYSQPYEDILVGTRGTYKAIHEDDMASQLDREEKARVHAAKLRAATAKIQSLSKKVEEMENAQKNKKKKKPWWQFW